MALTVGCFRPERGSGAAVLLPLPCVLGVGVGTRVAALFFGAVVGGRVWVSMLTCGGGEDGEEEEEEVEEEEEKEEEEEEEERVGEASLSLPLVDGA